MTDTPADHIDLWVALPTPFLANAEVDHAGLRLNVEKCVEAGLDGVYCNGLMGEVWALDPNERKAVLETIVEAGAGRVMVSPVTSGRTLEESLDYTRHAQQVGATHAVLSVPTDATGDGELVESLTEVIGAVDMPYILFNPGRDGSRESLLTPGAFAQLCRIENVRILKTTATDAENNRLRQIAAGTHVLVSDPLEEHFFTNMTQSGQRVLYCDPEGYLYQSGQNRPIREYVDLYLAGHHDLARQRFDSLAPLRAVYRKWIIGPLEHGAMPNAALKRWCEAIGMAGGPVRPHLAELSPAQCDEFDRDLAAATQAVAGPVPF